MLFDADSVDAGLPEPVRAGTAVEAATSDAAHLRALLDVEVAPARAGSGSPASTESASNSKEN
ncbi:hypothetical protein ABZS54_34680, partial [Embleya sp. NPDC005575]